MSAASLRPHAARRLLAALAAATFATLLSAAPALAEHCAPGDPAGATYRVAFQSGNGKWVTNDRTYVDFVYGRLRASADSIGQREVFTLVCLGDKQFGLITVGGQRVTADLTLTGWRYGMLRPRTTWSFGPAERFTYFPYDGDDLMDGPFELISLAGAVPKTVNVEDTYTGAYYGLLRAGGSWTIASELRARFL